MAPPTSWNSVLNLLREFAKSGQIDDHEILSLCADLNSQFLPPQNISTSSSQTSNRDLIEYSDSLLADSIKIIQGVALIRTDQIQPALNILVPLLPKLTSQSWLQNSSLSVKSSLASALAYAYYKSGQLTSAHDFAKNTIQQVYTSPCITHVLAQTFYRLEKFSDALHTYTSLLFNPIANLSSNQRKDTLVNIAAVKAQLLLNGTQDFMDLKDDFIDLDNLSHELAYNYACWYLSKGDYHQAKTSLMQSDELCSSSNYLSATEKSHELYQIRAQNLYCELVPGANSLNDVSTNISSAVSSLDKICDKSHQTVHQIAQVNRYVAEAKVQVNPVSQFLRYNDIMKLPQDKAPFHYQNLLLQYNCYVSSLEAGKYSGVLRSSSKFLSQHPPLSIDPLVNATSTINAAAHILKRGLSYRTSLNYLKKIVHQRPTDIALNLLLIQFLLQRNSPESARQHLQDLLYNVENYDKILPHNVDRLEIRFCSGLSGLAVDFYRHIGMERRAARELKLYVNFWHNRGRLGLQRCSTRLLTEAAISFLKTWRGKDLLIVRDILVELGNRTDQLSVNTEAFCDYVGGINSRKCDDVSEFGLPMNAKFQTCDGVKFSQLVDVEALEELGIPPLASHRNIMFTKGDAEENFLRNDTSIHKRTNAGLKGTKTYDKHTDRQISNRRLPKEFIKNFTPDKERWVRLRDRSTYNHDAKSSKASKRKGPTNQRKGTRKDKRDILAQGAIQSM